MSRTIIILDINGQTLASSTARSTARRISMRCAADQKQIDEMYRTGASTAEIHSDGHVDKFTFRAGKSYAIFPGAKS